MKKTVLLSLSLAFLAACSGVDESDNNDQSAAQNDTAMAFYGAEFNLDEAITVNEMLEQLRGKDSVEVTVAASIQEVCQKKGCWMDVHLGEDESMLVRFKDYDFFVPMNAAGQVAVMEGVVKVDTMTVDWLRHKASDAGKSKEEIAAITEPEVKYSFMARGVAIGDKS